MKWKVQITGDEKYLEALRSIFNKSAIHLILRDESGYYLNPDLLNSFREAKEISEFSETLLTFISFTPPQKTQRDVEVLKISSIKKNNDDGSYEMYRANGDLDTSGDERNCKIEIPKVDVSLNALTPSTNYNGCLLDIHDIENLKDLLDKEDGQKIMEDLDKHIDNLINYSEYTLGDSTKREIVSILTSLGKDLELAKWTAMRKMYESIRNDIGEEAVKRMIGEQLANDFYYTASYYHMHPANKGPERHKKPNRKIPLDEGEEIISKLVSAYIEYKVKNYGTKL